MTISQWLLSVKSYHKNTQGTSSLENLMRTSMANVVMLMRPHNAKSSQDPCSYKHFLVIMNLIVTPMVSMNRLLMRECESVSRSLRYSDILAQQPALLGWFLFGIHNCIHCCRNLRSYVPQWEMRAWQKLLERIDSGVRMREMGREGRRQAGNSIDSVMARGAFGFCSGRIIDTLQINSKIKLEDNFASHYWLQMPT